MKPVNALTQTGPHAAIFYALIARFSALLPRGYRNLDKLAALPYAAFLTHLRSLDYTERLILVRESGLRSRICRNALFNRMCAPVIRNMVSARE